MFAQVNHLANQAIMNLERCTPTEKQMVTYIACLEKLSAPLESILNRQNWFWSNFGLFGYICLESILVFRIDSRRSENFLLSIRITFRGTTEHKSLYLKINSIQINSVESILSRINSTKAEPNTHVVTKQHCIDFGFVTSHAYSSIRHFSLLFYWSSSGTSIFKSRSCPSAWSFCVSWAFWFSACLSFLPLPPSVY